MKPCHLIVTLAILWTASSIRAEVIAGPITNAANGHLYYLLSPKSFLESEAEAVELGGHLVTIDDATENAWVQSNFSTYDGVQRAIMIGLTDMIDEGTFIWISGSSSTYRNWFSGEPNNSGGNEDFVHLWWPNEGRGSTWNDTSGNLGVPNPINGLVEVDPIIISIRVSQVELCWNSQPDEWYQIQYSSPLDPSGWVDFGPAIQAAGNRLCVKEPVNAGNPPRFYQVIKLP